MVRLCVQCGESFPDGAAACLRCHAPPPRWQPLWRSPSALAAACFEWAAMAGGGLLCLFAAFAFVREWLGPGFGQRLLQVALGLVIVGAGVPVGLALLWNALGRLFVRGWFHPMSEGAASATTRFGRLLAASGAGRTVGAPLDVPPSGLSGIEAFAHYGLLRRALPVAYGLANNPARVDLALMAALLALAGRRQAQVRVDRRVAWSHDGVAVTRHELTVGVDVRRTGAPSATAGADPVEALLLGAMPPAGVRVAATEGLLPYRAPGAATEPGADAPWAPLTRVIFALSGGDPQRRRELRAALTAALAGGPAARPDAEVLAELVATIDATGDRSLGAAIVRQVEQGFATRAA
jgi:hypothetical protein